MEGMGGSFKRIGCLPENAKTDVGEYVIFQPPAIPLPLITKSYRDSVVTVQLKIIDDNGTQPKDPDVIRNITITTRRYKTPHKNKADEYVVTVEADKPKVPTAPEDDFDINKCKAIKDWEKGKKLVKPSHKFPEVEHGSVMA